MRGLVFYQQRLLHKFSKDEDKTVIVVTHDEDIVKIAEKKVYLKDGKTK